MQSSRAQSQSCRKSLSVIGIIILLICSDLWFVRKYWYCVKLIKNKYFHFLQSDNFAMTLIRPAFSSLSRLLSSFNFVTVWKGKVSHLVQQKLGLAQTQKMKIYFCENLIFSFFDLTYHKGRVLTISVSAKATLLTVKF